jgi:hypothetical protein
LTTEVARIVRDQHFDYVSWTGGALAAKFAETLWGAHPFMREADRTDYVRAYMADLARVQTLDGQIDFIYADPFIRQPDAASAAARAERDALRASLEQRQSLAEAVLEGQTAAVLVGEGFGIGGQLLPPMAMRFARVPNFMVLSPRDRVEFTYGFAIQPAGVEEQTALETAVETAREDVSALIVPLGGIALFPAMILERSSIPASLDTFAHEWLHHYLAFYPLGLGYEFDNETRIINETAATLFGREVSRLVLARYYPDLLPAASRQPYAPVVSAPLAIPAYAPQPAPPQPTAFDYGAAMNETRLRVDELLAQGQVDEAEAYMEIRRQLFVANGYLIRRLNQAYFAFYGGYQSGTPGAGGSDPIGPAVQRVRDQQPTLLAWVTVMRGISTREQLLALAAD